MTNNIITNDVITNDYNAFNFNSDYTPQHFIFNTNTTNERYVGIGTINPEHFLTVRSDIHTENLFIKNHFTFTTPSLHDNVSFLQLNDKGTVIMSNIISSINDDTGVEWSVVNNNNIKLTLRNHYDNVRLDYFSNYYIVNQNIFNINIYPKNTITIRYIYIIKNHNSLLNEIDINNLNNNNIIIKTPNFSSTLLHSTTNIFKLSDYITLPNNQSDTITIQNLNGYKIQLLGVYDYYSGSLWNNEKNTTYTMKNVGIGTSNPQTNLHIMGNSHITGNLTIHNALISQNLNCNEAFISGNSTISNILTETDSLIINPNNLPIGIGTVLNDDVFSIGEFFKIKQNNTIISKNANVTGNINIIDKTQFIKNNFSFSLQNDSLIYAYNNTPLINNTPKNINISKLNIIDPNINYEPNIIASNDISLFVDGNTSITGNFGIGIMDNITYNPINNYNINTLLSSNIIVNNVLYNEGFTYSDTVDTDVIETTNLFIPINNFDSNTNETTTTDNLPNLYFNKNTNKFMFFDSETTHELLDSTSLINKYELTKLHTLGTSNISSIHSEYIETDTFVNNHTLNFGQESLLYFNLNSMREEVLIYNNSNSNSNNNTSSYIFDIIY
jgi:hypothetical protein